MTHTSELIKDEKKKYTELKYNLMVDMCEDNNHSTITTLFFPKMNQLITNKCSNIL